jgi:hypothetical protein
VKFRLSSTFSTAFSPALHTQLLRYTQAKNITRAKAIRRAVYELLDPVEPKKKTKPPSLHPFTAAPKRTETVSWTLPPKKPAHRKLLDDACYTQNISVAQFTRRAVYLYTIDYASTDKEEAAQALADGWA